MYHALNEFESVTSGIENKHLLISSLLLHGDIMNQDYDDEVCYYSCVSPCHIKT